MKVDLDVDRADSGQFSKNLDAWLTFVVFKFRDLCIASEMKFFGHLALAPTKAFPEIAESP